MIKTLRILDSEWSVFWYNKCLPDDPEQEHWGQCNKDKRYIEIRVHDHLDFTADTLIHEILHAVWYEYQMGDEASEEEAVSKLGSGFVKVIKANPDLLAFLIGIHLHPAGDDEPLPIFLVDDSE